MSYGEEAANKEAVPLKTGNREKSMGSLVRMLFALVAVGILAAVIMGTLLPAAVLVAVGYAICRVWQALQG